MIKNLLIFITLITAYPVCAKNLYHANESSLQVSRYVDLMPGPTEAQQNPLHLVLPNVVFNQKIKSVGQAINYLLKDTGYKLTRFHPDKRVYTMFRLPLPKIHRHMGPLTLEQALKTLSGEPWMLAVDPINRLISFQLPDLYKTQIKTSHLNSTNRNKAKVNRVQQQVTRALKKRPLAKKRNDSQKRKLKPVSSVRKTTQRKLVKPKKIIKQRKKVALNLNTITWAELPKELR